MSIVGELELNEVIAVGLRTVMEEHLPTIIDEINAEATDGIVLPPPAQIHSHIGTEASAEAGMPIFGVADMPSEFEDDLVSSLTASYEFYLHVVMQESDHAILVKMIRRYVRAIALSIQRDRQKSFEGGTPTLGRGNLGVWAVMLKSTQPGPLLGERNPNAPDNPPNSYLSWSGIIVSCKREEI